MTTAGGDEEARCVARSWAIREIEGVEAAQNGAGCRNVPLADLLERLSDTVRPECEERGLAFRVEVDASKTVRVNAEALLAVLRHLCVAVAEAAPAGETLQIGAKCDGPGAALIRISDSGAACDPTGRRRMAASCCGAQLELCRDVLAPVGGGVSRIKRPDGGWVHWVSLPDTGCQNNGAYRPDRDGDRRRRGVDGALPYGERRRAR